MPASTKLLGGLRLLATLAILVLAFGLPRLLRICDHGDHRHLVVAFGGCEHARADACTTGDASAADEALAAAEAGGSDDERTPPQRHDERRGTSSGSAFELGAPPRPFDLPPSDGAANTLQTPWLPPAAQRRPTPPPPATGPPRPDDRTALRRTTRLQV